MEKKVLVLINGKAGSGKDTFVKFCQEIAKVSHSFIPIVNIHRSDNAKNILRSMGWNGMKTEKIRTLLADLVDFGEETGYNNKELFDSISRLGGVIFYHVRDPKTIAEIEEHYWFQENVHCLSLLVTRNSVTEEEPDRWSIEDYAYGRIVENKTLTGLKKEAEEFLNYTWKILEV